MKILFLGKYNDSEILSGPEKVAKRLFHETAKRGCAAFVEYFFDGRKYSFRKKLSGYELLSETETILRLGLFQIIAFLLRYKPSVIHIITFERFSILAFLLKPLLHCKICATIHGIARYEIPLNGSMPLLYKIKDYIFEWILFKFSDRLVFLSSGSIALAGKYYNLSDKQISIIPNGVDRLFHEQSLKRNGSSGALKTLFVGDSQRKEKGLSFLLDTLKTSPIPVELRIIGDFQPLKEVSDKIEITCIPKQQTRKYAEELLQSDIFISASIHDSFSISAAEAMASGLVPVVSRQTGISELITDGENGFIYDYGDKEKLLQIIKIICNEIELREYISEKASGIYYDLTWPKISQVYFALYKELVFGAESPQYLWANP